MDGRVFVSQVSECQVGEFQVAFIIVRAYLTMKFQIFEDVATIIAHVCLALVFRRWGRARSVGR